LAGLEAFLDPPLGAGDLDQPGQSHRSRCPGAVEREFPGAAVAPQQQPMLAGTVVGDD
jgi:hypothetical protein